MEKVLDGVRPFLSVAGGSIKIQSLTGVSSIQVTRSFFLGSTLPNGGSGAHYVLFILSFCHFSVQEEWCAVSCGSSTCDELSS